MNDSDTAAHDHATCAHHHDGGDPDRSRQEAQPARSHGHDHACSGHSHAPVDFGRAFAIGIALNIAFVVIETAFGLWSNSMALLADAGHNLSDVASLAVAWFAAELSRRPPTARYTYGLRATSILAALFNAVLLLIAIAAIAFEAMQRLAHPGPVASTTMMVVAAVGIAVNSVTAWLFASGTAGDINIRSAYLHMAADAAISGGVVLAGLAIWLTGWTWLDPAASLVIVAVIGWGTWGLLRESGSLALGGVPRHIDGGAVRAFLASQPGVERLHDLHIWPMSTTQAALTAHLVMPAGHPGDAFLKAISAELETHHHIGHTTLQIETSADCGCALEPDHVV